MIASLIPIYLTRFTEWARRYGDIYSLKLGPGTVIVLTGMEAVEELMQKRSATTVDRPPSHIAETITGGLNMALARYCKLDNFPTNLGRSQGNIKQTSGGPSGGLLTRF